MGSALDLCDRHWSQQYAILRPSGFKCAQDVVDAVLVGLLMGDTRKGNLQSSGI